LQSHAILAKQERNSSSKNKIKEMNVSQEAPKTGTTIVAAVYDGGIVIGADTRVSTGALC
jgi:20S proteasome alpha/beta subunit